MKKNTTIYIHPNYEHLRNEIENLPDNFLQEGRLIRNKRNHLRETQWQGISICIKSFKKPTALNQFVYSFFRMGKAQRSFTYAKKLLEYGIDTPAPIAYIIERNHLGLLSQSYYLSEYENHQLCISQVSKVGLPVDEQRKLVDSFMAEVVEKFHHNGIINKDFNGTNILISEAENNYHFSYIDINRIRFKKKVTHRQALDQLSMLSSEPNLVILFAEAYAKLKQLDSTETIFELFTTKYFNRRRRRKKEKAKKTLKSLIGTKRKRN